MLETLSQAPWFQPVAAMLVAAVGFVLCFFGLQLFRIVMALLGFAAGAWAPFLFFNAASFRPPWLAAVVLVVGGLAGAALLVRFSSLAVALLVGINAAWLSGFFWEGKAADWWPAVPLLAGIVGGLLALRFKKLLIVLFSAATGSLLLVAGLLSLTRLAPLPWQGMKMEVPAPGVLVAWAVIALVGLFVQYRWTSPDKEAPGTV